MRATKAQKQKRQTHLSRIRTQSNDDHHIHILRSVLSFVRTLIRGPRMILGNPLAVLAIYILALFFTLRKRRQQ
jgi:hypothetical protein